MNDNQQNMAVVKDMQMKLAEIQAGISVFAQSENGEVKITINGKRQIQNLEIENNLFIRKELLQNYILTATNHAIEKVDARLEEVKQTFLANFLSQQAQ
ncbi:YbaB/EbfC family nucleoid-associated protein [Pseudarcicella hirudinis]|nr:YbaB/EbfC family nucleoid-associated protein [Pseudarcicella hirudinis]